MEKYSWNKHYTLTAINKQNATVSHGHGRENGNFEEGSLLKAFSWRQPRFFFTLPERPSNVVMITLIPTTRLLLRHSYMFPNHFSSVHHAGFNTPWSTGIFWSFLFIERRPDVAIH